MRSPQDSFACTPMMIRRIVLEKTLNYILTPLAPNIHKTLLNSINIKEKGWTDVARKGQRAPTSEKFSDKLKNLPTFA